MSRRRAPSPGRIVLHARRWDAYPVLGPELDILVALGDRRAASGYWLSLCLTVFSSSLTAILTVHSENRFVADFLLVTTSLAGAGLLLSLIGVVISDKRAKSARERIRGVSQGR